MRNPIPVSGWNLLTSSVLKTTDSAQDFPFSSNVKIARSENNVIVTINLAGAAGEDVTVLLNEATHVLSVRLDSESRTYSTEFTVDPYVKATDIKVFWNEGLLEISFSEPVASSVSETVELPVHVKEPEDSFTQSKEEPVSPGTDFFRNVMDAFYETTSQLEDGLNDYLSRRKETKRNPEDGQ